MFTSKFKKIKLIQAVRNTHRLFGFVLSILFFTWCITGFVMMYKEFPSVSKKEYNAMRSAIVLKPDSKIANVKQWEYKQLDSCTDIRIYQILDKTIINISDNKGEIICLDAHTGKKTTPINENELSSLIKNYYNNQKEVKKIEVITELDQWIPRTNFLPHMPIYKVLLNDKEETICYISSKSGEIIQKLTLEDKVWAWLGPIPHWIYFKTLRINTDAWRIVVISLSSLGVLLALLGIILGINRTLIAKKKSQQFTPYKKKWFRWHHYMGFAFGIFIFTWILSGLLSMNPLKWASEDSLSQEEIKTWQAANFKVLDTLTNFENHVQGLIKNDPIKEIKFSLFNSKLYAITVNKYNIHIPINIQNTNMEENRVDISFFENSVKYLIPNHQIISKEVLNDYDNYYYNKHRTLPLPVYRFKFNDNCNTWLYVNPKTLTVVKKMQTDNKIERWLYNGLHSLDFSFLLYRRPLWDVVVIILLLSCAILSFTGLKLTINNVFRNIKKRT